jgi:hypothetical protein
MEMEMTGTTITQLSLKEASADLPDLQVVVRSKHELVEMWE